MLLCTKIDDDVFVINRQISNIRRTLVGKQIDLFHNNFSPSGKQLEHRKLAHEL